jgi:hypothetical protein
MDPLQMQARWQVDLPTVSPVPQKPRTRQYKGGSFDEQRRNCTIS